MKFGFSVSIKIILALAVIQVTCYYVFFFQNTPIIEEGYVEDHYEKLKNVKGDGEGGPGGEDEPVVDVPPPVESPVEEKVEEVKNDEDELASDKPPTKAPKEDNKPLTEAPKKDNDKPPTEAPKEEETTIITSSITEKDISIIEKVIESNVTVHLTLNSTSFIVEEMGGCVHINGWFSWNYSGASVWSMLSGPLLRRVHFHEIQPLTKYGMTRYEMENVALCRAGLYVLDVRIDWVSGESTVNCKFNNTRIKLAPVYRGQNESHFASFLVESTASQDRGVGEWVWSEMGYCVPREACLPAEQIIVQNLYEQNRLALGGLRGKYLRLGNCIAAILKDEQNNGTHSLQCNLQSEYEVEIKKAWVWFAADRSDIASPRAITQGLNHIRSWGESKGISGSRFWLHWVGDSIDVRGPVNVLLNLLDNLQFSLTAGKVIRKTLCFDGDMVKETTFACGEGNDETNLNGLRGTGSATNIWTWELSPDWTIHVTFTKTERIQLEPLSNLIGNISRYGMDLPPRPQALVMNYGLHFNMLNADFSYQQILNRTITTLQQQLSALGGDRTVVI